MDSDTDVDALKIAKSLPEFAANIRGIVPQFGGRCFDITLDSADAAAQLAQSGYDYGDVRKSLKLLGARSIHVSIFVSVEFPDDDLLKLLAMYGERVAEFNKIDRAIPKRLILAGMEIGFKYSGQPVMCHRCQSTEHMVKNCLKNKRRAGRYPPPSQVTQIQIRRRLKCQRILPPNYSRPIARRHTLQPVADRIRRKKIWNANFRRLWNISTKTRSIQSQPVTENACPPPCIGE